MSLPTSEKEGIRYQVNQNIQKLYTQQRGKRSYPNWKITHERRVINQIRQKLSTEEAMMTKADKGNTIVVLYSNDYNKKVNNFIAENNFNLITSNITDRLQKEIRNAIRESTNLIPKDKRWQFINLNPSIPNIRGLVKIHKTEAPIRPIVNWENSPAYKVAKMLTSKLHTYTPLPYTYNIKNSAHLISDLKEIPYDPNLRLAPLDITVADNFDIVVRWVCWR
jgi:hypothetical protein